VVYDARGRASGIQKTASGVMLEPPRKRRLWWRWVLFVAEIVGGIMNVISGLIDGGGFGVGISALVSLIIAYLIYRFLLNPARRYNREVYPAELRRWEQSWTCNQCGSIFDINHSTAKAGALQ
ncbi:MAG: hypothetical protein K6T63_15255, partial [Alicyclobacillus herbarius]|uniref:hypothetical protein n=1 Tax=Alicyclobacillus herbarius TaxID=122960 RepID=UPI0023539773